VKIRTKLLLFLVPVAVGAVLLTTELSRRAVHGVVAGEVAKRGIAATAAVALDPRMLEGYRLRSESALLEPLTRFAESVDAVSAAAMGDDGAVLAHTNVAEQGGIDLDPLTREVLRSGKPGHKIASINGRSVMVISVPVFDPTGGASEGEAFLLLGSRDKPRLGVLRVWLPLEDALTVSSRISNQVLLIVAIACSVTLSLMLIALGRVLAPVPALVAATKSVGEGNLGATVPVLSRDEIGDLAQSFNRMSRYLAETTVSREFLNSILTHMQDLLLVTRPDGTVRMANESAVKLLALPGADLIGRRVEELVLLPERAGKTGLEVLRHSTTSADGGFLRPNGEIVPALIGVSALDSSDGEAQGYIVTGKDITDLRRTQDELRETVSSLRATLDSTADGILVVDQEGRIMSHNQNFLTIWRIPFPMMEKQDEAALKLVLKQLHDPDGFVKKVNEVYAQPEVESYDILAFKDGRTIERYSRPRRLEGISLGRVWSFRDITDRREGEAALRRSEDQLRQAQKMEAVGSLAGGVAHDFNNILTIIKGYCQLLIRSLGEGAKGHREIVEVLKAAERAAALTRQLLAFSRKQVLQPKVLDLNVAVTDMDRMLHRLIGEDIELRTIRHDNLGTVMADPSQIEQVILNLVVNARDAMPSGGTITVETANFDLDASAAFSWPDLDPGRYVVLTVTDTGFGMDAATISRIFEPFFTTKTHDKGTGLGLSTVYGIVKQSGGSIAVESEPGSGTTFRVCLPRLDAVADLIPGHLPEPAMEAPRGDETILLAEDEKEVRALASATLRYAGYTVLEAADGIEAMEMSAKHEGPIHLLVTDVVMPRMGGGALTGALARERPEARVIYMSGYTDDDVVRHGVLDTGIPFLQKPFGPDDLARMVRRVLDSPAPMQAIG
jgi:PAS domain S-box-containing protein